MTSPLSPAGRLAGIDFGAVRLGVALCDTDRKFVTPHEVLTRGTSQQDAAYFQKLAREWRLVGFVVGLPVHLSGDESENSKAARAFAAWLLEVVGLPVALCDERYSTAQAEDQLSSAGLSAKERRARRDMLAAQVILSEYLESQSRRTGNDE